MTLLRGGRGDGMKKKEAERLWYKGRTPTLADLVGEWRVRMWGFPWRIMCLDKKVIEGKRGYNVILGVRWGDFLVAQLKYTLRLKYNKGDVIDYLKIHPDNDDIMIGRYCTKKPGRSEKYKAICTLTRI